MRIVEQKRPAAITAEPAMGWDNELPPQRSHRWRDLARALLRRKP